MGNGKKNPFKPCQDKEGHQAKTEEGVGSGSRRTVEKEGERYISVCEGNQVLGLMQEGRAMLGSREGRATIGFGGRAGVLRNQVGAVKSKVGGCKVAEKTSERGTCCFGFKLRAKKHVEQGRRAQTQGKKKENRKIREVFCGEKGLAFCQLGA